MGGCEADECTEKLIDLYFEDSDAFSVVVSSDKTSRMTLERNEKTEECWLAFRCACSV